MADQLLLRLLAVAVGVAGGVFAGRGAGIGEGGAARDANAAEAMPYIVGADISWVQQWEEQYGRRWSEKGQEKDILEILKGHGFNYIRLRVFNDPTKGTPRDRPYSPAGYCDLAHTIMMGKRVKAAGMGLLIDFHYSDAWADPGKQFTPAAWKDLPFDGLVKAMHDWTKEAVGKMKEAGCEPEMVQVGNEITPGMMTDGADGGGSTRNWVQLGKLLKAGIAGVREVDPKIVVMLHIDRGGDNAGARRWVDGAMGQGVEFDVLGLSCYQRWQGPPERWKANFEDLAGRYPKLKFVMAEVDAQAMPANEIMKGLPEGRGLGTFIWEPEANNAGQGLFEQPAGFGRRGAARTGPASGPGAAPAALGVLEEKLGEYDKVVERSGG